MIKLQGVWKIFPDGTKALKDIDLSIEEGEFVGLMGPSGSGKSTLLHIIGGLEKPSKGEVYLFEERIDNLSESQLASFRKGKVAYVFQFYYLLEDFSVLENLTLVGQLVGKRNPEEEALEILSKLRLSHRINHKPSQLSGGEQQRVAIGRAIISGAKLILADEPTGNVDWEEGKKIFSIFKEMSKSKGITFVVATHNPELRGFFTRTILLKDGRIVGEV